MYPPFHDFKMFFGGRGKKRQFFHVVTGEKDRGFKSNFYVFLKQFMNCS
jgi:hypothetical protein